MRYARPVKALGAHVSLVTNRVLQNLARSLPGVDRVLGPGEEAPMFDYYVHLLGLPRVFGTDEATVPREVPYLHADPARVEEARALLAAAGAGLKVGLVWSGAVGNGYNRRRAVPLAQLAPLLEIPGVRWFSLHKGDDGITADDAACAERLVRLEMRNDFDGTAALIEALDLVVSVDTSLAHLAGALGKPVCLMLPWSPHWVWHEGRDDSPWYPTMRLFRQTQPGRMGRRRRARARARRVGRARRRGGGARACGQRRGARTGAGGRAAAHAAGIPRGVRRRRGNAARDPAVRSGRAGHRRRDRLVRRVAGAATAPVQRTVAPGCDRSSPSTWVSVRTRFPSPRASVRKGPGAVTSRAR